MSKHILLSGGNRGLGLAIGKLMLREGYTVTTFSRTRTTEIDELEKEHPNTFGYLQGDLGDRDSLSTIVRQCVKDRGPLFGVINNSAMAVDGVLATLPVVEIERMIDVNLTGSIALTRLVLRSMLKSNDGGRVINISSIVGIRGFSGLGVYAATKAGLDGFTRGLSREVGRRGITVNSVLPGYMRTAMSSGLEEGRLDQITRRTPFGRLAEPEDVAPLVLFLLSEGARFITGQSIVVDGGASV